jgi:hypothetical protein
MRIRFLVLPALLLAGAAAAQSAGRMNPADPQASVPPVEYRSAFEGYRPFAEEDLRDWRKSNDAVGAAGGHAGHRPGQGPGQQAPKPQAGKPESSGGPAQKRGDAHPDQGHGGHK